MIHSSEGWLAPPPHISRDFSSFLEKGVGNPASFLNDAFHFIYKLNIICHT